MATDPRNQLLTLSYAGGTVTGAKGLLEYFLPVGNMQWTPQSGGANGKRKYGTIQRANARPGRLHYIKFTNGETYSVRVTGSSIKFIDKIIASGTQDKISAVYTQSGTKYARQFPQAVAQ
jgi:hypothetical protein